MLTYHKGSLHEGKINDVQPFTKSTEISYALALNIVVYKRSTGSIFVWSRVTGTFKVTLLIFMFINVKFIRFELNN